MFKQISKFVICKTRPRISSSVLRYQSSDTSDSFPTHVEKCINQVTLLGRAGSIPQKRGNDKYPVVIFSLATNNRYEVEGQMVTKAEWHRISVFKPTLRDTIYTYLQKGQRVYVTGRLSYGELKDESGNLRPTTSIIADDIVLFRPND